MDLLVCCSFGQHDSVRPAVTSSILRSGVAESPREHGRLLNIYTVFCVLVKTEGFQHAVAFSRPWELMEREVLSRTVRKDLEKECKVNGLIEINGAYARSV